MPFYASSEQFYNAMQLLFERLRSSEANPVDKLAASHLSIRMRFSNPSAEIAVNGRQKPVTITYGPSQDRPDLDVEMSIDTFHKILTHEVSLKSAFANRQMKVLGPIWKTAPLADILTAGREIYPQILREQGLITP